MTSMRFTLTIIFYPYKVGQKRYFPTKPPTTNTKSLAKPRPTLRRQNATNLIFALNQTDQIELSLGSFGISPFWSLAKSRQKTRKISNPRRTDNYDDLYADVDSLMKKPLDRFPDFRKSTGSMEHSAWAFTSEAEWLVVQLMPIATKYMWEMGRYKNPWRFG